MWNIIAMRLLPVCALLLFCTNIFADNTVHHAVDIKYDSDKLEAVHADGHGPIGVIAEHMHKKGEWMLSYRYRYMEMRGNRINDDTISTQKIATRIPNRFFGLPGQPPTLRIVPTEMTMEMHMLGAMYAPVDWLTLMAMAMHVRKSMRHITFAGRAGASVLGTFETKTSGLGDTKIGGLIRLHDSAAHHLHLHIGASLPTGDNNKTGSGLAPNSMRPTLRLPYPMQIGSGTVDLLTGITWTRKQNRYSWGAQYLSTLRIGRDEGYRLGDRHELNGWLAYLWYPWVSSSIRLSYSHQGKIDGLDPNIIAPVQTADPDNQGGDNIMLHLGFNLAGQSGRARGHRLAFEVDLPLYRNLNGPQLETDFILIAGWQYAF